MISTFIVLMGCVIAASILQKNMKIPLPITLMVGVLLASISGIQLFEVDNKFFDNLVIITLPLLIASDAFKLKFSDIVSNGFSLFWVAVVSVLLSVGAGILLNNFVLIDYKLSIAAVAILFSMVSATDPITVSAIFSNFKVPHKLKILTEGESLFNDATALIVFSIGVVALQNPELVTPSFIAFKAFSVIFGATIIGLVFGYLITLVLRISDEPLIEATIILFFVYLSYLTAEHWHFSGILSVIIATVMANREIQKNIDEGDAEMKEAGKTSNWNLFKHAITTKDNQDVIFKTFDFVSMFAAAMLFISIAAIADVNKLMSFKYEIIAVFIASTIIRGIMMLKFALISNKVNFMQSIKKHWWAVLTFAGSKGALSILMVHMLPNTFEYKEMFEYIIIGNILLSTFVYAFILAIIFVKNAKLFEAECLEEEKENH